MDFTSYTTQLQKAMKRYQKDADKYGVSSDPWMISKLTSTEINIIIPAINGLNFAVKVTTDETKPFKIMYYDSDGESFELTNGSCIQHFYKPSQLIVAMDDAADWLISNAM